jgi:hypothetical protein
MDRNLVLESEVARVLRAHIENENKELKKRGVVCLTGNQWVVIEVFVLSPDDIRTKVLGVDPKTNQAVSAPISYFKEKQFCGIKYYSDPLIRSEHFRQMMAQLAREHKNGFAIYNPHQHKAVVLHSPVIEPEKV